MDIEHWRQKIDEVDTELLRLLNIRAGLAVKIGVLKKEADIPLCDPVRERFVLERLRDLNEGPLDQRAIERLFRRIIWESRRIETDKLDTSEPISHSKHSEQALGGVS